LRKTASLILLAAMTASIRADAKPEAPCPRFARFYPRLADLPAGAAAALGFPIAERGAPWNATDVVRPGPMLPFARFISAQGRGCLLTISYEHGGIAHSFERATLERRGRGWARVQGP